MLTALTMSLILIGNPQPAPAPVEPPKVVAVQITGIENAVLSFESESAVKWLAVKTADGPRVRLTAGKLTLEAARFQIKIQDKLITMEAKMHGREAIVVVNVKKPSDEDPDADQNPLQL